MVPINTSGVNTGTWLEGSTPSLSIEEKRKEYSTSEYASSEEGLKREICPICKGAGFVYPLLDSSKPDFSQVVPCQCRESDLRRKKLGYLEKYSNLGPLSRFTFDNLSPKGKGKDVISRENFTRAYQAAKNFAEHPMGWLIFLGPCGCGKTHLSCAIAQRRLSLGQPAFYIGVPDLLDHLRKTFNTSSDITYDELFELVKNTPLLVLDELSMGSNTVWAQEKLEQLLNYRFNNGLPTVITTDVPIEKLDEHLRGHFTDKDFCLVCVIQQKPSQEHPDSLQLELLRNMTFDNFDCKRLELSLEQRQNLRQAFQLAVEFAQSPEGWLVFQGINGCGKTHLAASIANYQLAQEKPVFFVVVPDLLDHLRSTFSPESKISYDEFFEKIKTSPLLILDDFGEQTATPWAQEKLYQLINYRYNAKLPTVITTCFSLEEIELRVSSRMVDPRLSLVFNIVAPDYRGDIKPARRAKSSRLS